MFISLSTKNKCKVDVGYVSFDVSYQPLLTLHHIDKSEHPYMGQIFGPTALLLTQRGRGLDCYSCQLMFFSLFYQYYQTGHNAQFSTSRRNHDRPKTTYSAAGLFCLSNEPCRSGDSGVVSTGI
jgi:hypothetical protein